MIYGPGSGEMLVSGKNNVLIGYRAGRGLQDESDHIIIGDNIKNATDYSQNDVIFIDSPGHPIAIGKTVLGKECNLYDIIRQFAIDYPLSNIHVS